MAGQMTFKDSSQYEVKSKYDMSVRWVKEKKISNIEFISDLSVIKFHSLVHRYPFCKPVNSFRIASSDHVELRGSFDRRSLKSFICMTFYTI